jgi:hypothetical protein
VGWTILAVDLFPLKCVAEAGVEETRSRSVRALMNLLRIQVAYIPEGVPWVGHVTYKSLGHVTGNGLMSHPKEVM